MGDALRIAALACGLALAGGWAWRAGSSQGDRVFANEAARAGRADVKLARIAVERAGSGDVRAFAKRLIAEQEKTNDELAEIALRNGFTLHDDPSQLERKTAERLEKLTLADLDREYALVALEATKRDVVLFRDQGCACDDADLKELATRTLPAIEKRRKDADALAAKVGAIPKKEPGVE